MSELPLEQRRREQAWKNYEQAKRASEGAPTLSDLAGQRRKALRRAYALDCEAGFHDDPDNSGFCIRCGAGL